MKHFNKSILLISIIFLLVLFSLFVLYHKNRYFWVSNYEECVASGFNVKNDNPSRCILPNGTYFTSQLTNKNNGMKSLPFRVLLTGADIPNLYEEQPTNHIVLYFDEKDNFINFLSKNNIDLREQVDFVKYTAVVIIDSTKPTLGYGLSLLDYQVLNTGRNYFMVERQIPSSNCMQAQAISRPYVIAVIDKVKTADNKVEIIDREYNPCK